MADLKYALGAVCVFSFISAVGVGSAIGGNVGASFTYFFALLPIVFLAIGSTAPGIIIAVINNFRRKSKVLHLFYVYYCENTLFYRLGFETNRI